jgi:hypothetical protein
VTHIICHPIEVTTVAYLTEFTPSQGRFWFLQTVEGEVAGKARSLNLLQAQTYIVHCCPLSSTPVTLSKAEYLFYRNNLALLLPVVLIILIKPLNILKKMPSCGMFGRLDLVRTDVSEKHIASVIRVTRIIALGATETRCKEMLTSYC